ncbi:AAA family ATPase [Kitasatospora sp. NPDC087861]|uniref:AAA family ATPase n=1 Tax=Kitasatospora sp. NPDC087861 TaxID=3364070 RepID=UPI00382018BA
MKAATLTPHEAQLLAHAHSAPLQMANLFTLDDWNSFAREEVPKPTLATFTTHEARLIYNSHLRIVSHPALDNALLRASLAFRANELRKEGFLDMVIDGPPGTGKSFTLRAIGRAYQVEVEKKERGRIPVVHITVPPDTDGTINWIWEIACFLGLNPPPKDPQALFDQRRVPDLTYAVTHVLARSGTRVILIDDIQRAAPDQLVPVLHYLDFLRSRYGIAVIFCGTGAAGIVQAARVRADHLMGSDAGLRERVKKQRVKANAPDPKGSTEPALSLLPVSWLDPIHCHEGDQETWLSVLKGFEGNLCLRNFSTHALSKHAAYLHKRTGGYLKQLSHLVCHAAVDAMRENGEEDITLERLELLRVGRDND